MPHSGQRRRRARYARMTTAIATYRELLIGAGSEHSKRLAPDGHEKWANLTTLDMNADHRPDVVWDLTQRPLPFEDESFDEIHAYEVLEHISQQGDWRGFFEEFSEYYRILKPNGLLCGTCPSATSVWAWGDPGHTRIISRESFVFLNQAEYTKQVGKTAMSDYRFVFKGDFALEYDHDEGDGFSFVLRAIKPSRCSL